jgi:uncharacterized protein HemX
MRLAIVAVIVALLVGLGAGYLMWGERALRATDEERMRQAQQADSLQKQAGEVQKLKEELASERERRQRLEEVIRRGRQ